MLNIYSIYDNVCKEFGSVFLSKNDDTAKRSYLRSIESAPATYAINKKDFRLYCLGSMGIETGSIVAEKREVIVDEE